jgi:hypothetical protein
MPESCGHAPCGKRQPERSAETKKQFIGRSMDLNNYFFEFQLLEHIDKTGNPRNDACITILYLQAECPNF